MQLLKEYNGLKITGIMILDNPQKIRALILYLYPGGSMFVNLPMARMSIQEPLIVW